MKPRKSKAKVTVTEKCCTVCKTVKPAEGFYRKASDKTGLASACKACRSAQDKLWGQTPEGRAKNYINQKLWREQNPEKAREIAKKASAKYYAKNKELVNKRAIERRNLQKLKLFQVLKTAEPNQYLRLKARMAQ